MSYIKLTQLDRFFIFLGLMRLKDTVSLNEYQLALSKDKDKTFKKLMKRKNVEKRIGRIIEWLDKENERSNQCQR